MTGPEFAAGLRAIADWYDAYPGAPIRELGLDIMLFGDEAKKAVPELVRALAPCEKQHDASWLTLRREFLGLPLSFRLYREAVCEKRVVGHVHKAALFIPEHDEEVVEWDCHPLLASEDPGARAAAVEVVAAAGAAMREGDEPEGGEPEDLHRPDVGIPF